jgi:hypothetical protein
MAMDISEDFQTKAGGAGNSLPALSYATLSQKKKNKGKGKAKASLPMIPSKDLGNAIVIPDSPPPPIPSNAGISLRLTPPRANPKVPLGLPPPVNKLVPLPSF